MAIWSKRSNKKAQMSNQASKKSSKTAGNPYHCVELKMPYSACEAVLKLHGKRFLSAEAPQLPLPDCDQHCQCKFKHHNDRRSAEDRRDGFSPGGIHFDGDKNRRLGNDRRRRANAPTHLHLG